MTKKEIYAEFGIEYDPKTNKILSPYGYIRPVLVNGNVKIGRGAYHFSTLPTKQIYSVVINGQSYDVQGTCPCNCDGCYATKGNYRFKSVIKSLAIKTLIARFDMTWLENAIKAQIKADNIVLCRIHASGDFFSIEYSEMWKRIAIENPDCLFWTYTKNPACVNAFDGLKNANIVKSVIRGHGFNFGPCGYIMEVYRILKNAGKKVHICFCGIEKYAGIETKHCTNCHGCAENEFVLFLEHSTSYVAANDPLFPELVKMILAQDK